MNVHENARLTPKGRELLIERLARGEHPIDVAGAMGVSVRTLYKRRKRYWEGGLAALRGIASRAGRRPPPGPKAPDHKNWGSRPRSRGRTGRGRIGGVGKP